MSTKKTAARYLGYFIERPLLAFMYILIRILPLSFFLTLASLLGTTVAYLVPSHCRRITHNLNLAYSDTLNSRQKKVICRDATVNLFMTFLEVAYTVHKKNQHALINAVHLTGREYLDEALRRGNGVIAISAHQGNFAIMGLKMRSAGYAFHTVIREVSNPFRNSLYTRYQKHLGQSFIPSRSFIEVMRRILPALRRNEIVLLISDENRRRGGIPVDFFNRKTVATTGPAVLSLRTGAAVVPMFMIRNHDHSHTLVIQPPLELPRDKQYHEAVAEITQMITTCIEEQVRAYPSQWFWTQRRWQSRPSRRHQQETGLKM